MSQESHATIPLLNRPRKSHFRQLFFSYTVIGILLLIIYQLVFLPRTSASRDYDHLHETYFTNAQLRREVVRTFSNDSLAKYTNHYYESGRHLGGENKALAQYTELKLKEYGFKTELIQYDVYLNRPVEHRVALLDGSHVVTELSLEEDVLEEDPSTGDPSRTPTFFGYSPSGNVTGKLVYANYGRKEDFEALVNAKVELKDTIVLVRFGRIFRGLKVRLASEFGAKGVLIYSDPRDDSIQPDKDHKAYPQGPARNPSSVQRGSVQDLAYYAGDPTTPGYASLPGAKREPPQGLAPIPTLPISFRDAKPLLEALEGRGPKIFSEDDNNVGPSKLSVNLYSMQEYDIFPIYDVIAKLQGSSDEEIIIGNHRDAWVIGASDPNSGSAVLLELGRVFGGLSKQGFKPYRTLVLASWDAEEYGLVGSVEYGEDRAKHLMKHARAYLNVDIAYSGPRWTAESSPLLQDAILNASRRTPSPKNTSESLYDLWRSQPGGVRLGPLGSGSDFVVFQDHLGIPSINAGFGESKGSPVYHYHSNYDSLHWMKTFGDLEFSYHKSIGQFLGLLALDLTEPLLVPFNTHPYAKTISDVLRSYLWDHYNNPKVREVLDKADKLLKRTEAYDAYLEDLRQQYRLDFAWYFGIYKIILLFRIKVANYKLKAFEPAFLNKEGLDDRSWFKHIIWAPGRYTGYSGQVFPGIAEALEDNDSDKLNKWLDITKNALDRVLSLVS